MITTSFFASKAPRERKVSIAKWPPRYWNGARARKLAPSNPKAIDWKTAYREDLEKLFPNGVGLKEYLAEIEETTPNPILCCFESDPSECHRSLLAAYAKEKLNITISEWVENEQGSLLG